MSRSRRAPFALRVASAPLALLVALLASAGCPARGEALQVMSPLSTRDESVDRLLRDADHAAEQGQLAEARAGYQEIVQRHADDPVVPLAHLGLGRLAIGAGDHRAAIEELTRAERGDDEVVRERARLYRAIALHLQGSSAEAVELLQPLVGRTTNPEETRLLLDTLTQAALATGAHVVALRAIDARFDASEESERPELLARLRDAVERTLTIGELDAAYRELPRAGRAWPLVAERALRHASDRAELDRVREIAADLTERGVALDASLAALVTRAERIAEADPRVIGAILPLSGPARAIGQRALHGLMLAAGAPGRGPQALDAPQLVFRDDANDPERAAAAVDELVSTHRAVAIIGPLDPACAEAAAARAQALGVPLISLAARALQSSSPIAFRLMPTLDEELGALVSAAESRGARRMALLRPTSGWSDRVHATLQRLTRERGIELVADERYAANATSFTAEVTRVESANPDVVFLADSGARVALIAPALAAVGLWSSEERSASAAPTPARRGRPAIRPRAVLFLVPSVGLDARLPALAGRYFQGALFAAPFLAPAPPEAAANATAGATAAAAPGTPAAAPPTDLASFTAEYRSQFQSEPDSFAAYAFDAFRLVRGAIESGVRRRADVARWLVTSSAGRPTLGASGGFSTERGPRRAVSIATLEGTRFVVR